MLQIAILALVTVQRVAELNLARRNTRRLLAQGAREYGANHYPIIIVLHATWLLGLWAIAWQHPVSVGWLAAYAVLQVLRIWVLLSLGARWTTRIIVLPGEAPIRKGPYRFLANPNYAVVAGEIAVLPMVFSLPVCAAVFTLLNALVLSLRIGAANAALGSRHV